MRAADVMTTNLITVTPETSVRDLAELLGKYGISGVPVVDAAEQLVGIVSEADLLHRAEMGTERRLERRRGWFLGILASDQDLARDYLKSHARKVRDVMTRDVITVTETAGLDEIADLLEARRIRRLPVVRDGKLIGIVSRASLVRALAMTESMPVSDEAANDFTIRDALLIELHDKPWAQSWAAEIMVRDKIVHMWFSDDQPMEERQAIRVAAENTPGVEHVEEHLVHIPMNPVM